MYAFLASLEIIALCLPIIVNSKLVRRTALSGGAGSLKPQDHRQPIFLSTALRMAAFPDRPRVFAPSANVRFPPKVPNAEPEL